jgi:hypothetical protein
VGNFIEQTVLDKYYRLGENSTDENGNDITINKNTLYFRIEDLLNKEKL